MKLILSRKGFDSGAGGCPSPIFPDGSMVSLPIPDTLSTIKYKDLEWRGRSLSDILLPLRGAGPKSDDSAHLDPDLIQSAQPRHPDWRPLLGQTGAAQGHLRNEGVGPGDLFLFFGLYRRVDVAGHFIRSEPKRHVIWGWLQIDEIIQVDPHRNELAWVGNHPHGNRPPDPSNTLYCATDKLSLPTQGPTELPGAGVFEEFHLRLQLTDMGNRGPSLWRLPAWFSPFSRPSCLSYHRDFSRWTLAPESVQLQTVGKGQEFVLNVDDYPESIHWISGLMGLEGCRC